MPKFIDRLSHGWNAFMNRDPTSQNLYGGIGYSSSYPLHRPIRKRNNEKSVVNSIYNRIALDCASMTFTHVRLDENHNFVSEIDDELNKRLNVDANIDQPARAFIQDVVLSLFDEGVVAIIPATANVNPDDTSSYDIMSFRVAKIVEWFPKAVKLEAYDERDGERKETIMPKSMVAIVENPYFTIMNQSNSVAQRLIRKMNLLDSLDSGIGSNKLDLIIQLPYAIRGEARKQQAKLRQKEIDDQLNGSNRGIAYIDAAEHVTQLNRSVNNNLQEQIDSLTAQLHSQLGITPEIMNGTADPATLNNYFNRTVEPVVAAIVDAMICKFLSKTARSQKQSIRFSRDPFKIVPISDLSDTFDKLGRNEIATSNEMRAIIGWKPSNDPKANELRNSNISQAKQDSGGAQQIQDQSNIQNEDAEEENNLMMSYFDDLETQIDSILGG